MLIELLFNLCSNYSFPSFPCLYFITIIIMALKMGALAIMFSSHFHAHFRSFCCSLRHFVERKPPPRASYAGKGRTPTRGSHWRECLSLILFLIWSKKSGWTLKIHNDSLINIVMNVINKLYRI